MITFHLMIISTHIMLHRPLKIPESAVSASCKIAGLCCWARNISSEQMRLASRTALQLPRQRVKKHDEATVKMELSRLLLYFMLHLGTLFARKHDVAAR